MNAVEIEEAISALAEQQFDAEDFPFAFLLAFGNKEMTIIGRHFRNDIKRLEKTVQDVFENDDKGEHMIAI